LLAALYFKRGMDMFEELAEQNYLNSSKIVELLSDAVRNSNEDNDSENYKIIDDEFNRYLQILDINLEDVLIPKFELQEEKTNDKEYVPNYILDINEDLESMFECEINEMSIAREI
jgi:hypothetical protein